VVAALFSAAAHRELVAQGIQLSFGALVLRGLLNGTPWILASPFLIMWARRLPIAGPNRNHNLGWHLIAGPLWVLAAALVGLYVVWLAGLGRAPLVAVREIRLLDLCTDLALYALIVGIGTSMFLAERVRERERAAAALALSNAELEARAASAQLEVLRTRLEPHFMGNALNSVAALIRTGELQSAISMLTRLGELVQDALVDTAAVVPLRRELDVVRRYLEIEHIRFADRLTIEMPPDDATGDVPIPSFVIQPLVENALQHGVSRHRGPAHVRLNVLANGDYVAIQVDNSGPPLPDDWSFQSSARVGLSATMERLGRMYQGQARLQLESHGAGVRATLTLPRTGPSS
jgi:hypothetical protein